jgi:hypothetical protein
MKKPRQKNRKQIKARWIHVKNLMRKYPDCAYDGDFYCDHVYDPERPWVWVDFRFFHTKLKRYFAVAMVTAEYEAYTDLENRAIEQSAIIFPYTDDAHRLEDLNTDPIRSEQHVARMGLMRDIIQNEIDKSVFVRPSIQVKDYGPVAVGLWVTVNKPYIDEHVIREFITHFRSLGEPTKAGWYWHGEEVQINLNRFTAQS